MMYYVNEGNSKTEALGLSGKNLHIDDRLTWVVKSQSLAEVTAAIMHQVGVHGIGWEGDCRMNGQ